MSAWLDAREPSAVVRSREQNRMLRRSDWWLLRQLTFDTLISWSDGWFTATVRGLPAEATFGGSADEVLDAAVHMVLQAVDAPEELASVLKVRAQFSVEAVRALLSQP